MTALVTKMFLIETINQKLTVFQQAMNVKKENNEISNHQVSGII